MDPERLEEVAKRLELAISEREFFEDLRADLPGRPPAPISRKVQRAIDRLTNMVAIEQRNIEKLVRLMQEEE